MSKPTFTYHRYNEIGELLFFVDFYDENTNPPFDHYFEGHPTYFISFIALEYYHYFDEVIEYFVETCTNDFFLDKETVDVLMHSALDRISLTINPVDLESIPSYYLTKDLAVFRKDKVELDMLGLLLSSDPLLFNRWDDLIRIAMNYYNSYGVAKFNAVFPKKIRQIDISTYIQLADKMGENDGLLDAIKLNASFWQYSDDTIDFYYALSQSQQLITSILEFKKITS